MPRSVKINMMIPRRVTALVTSMTLFMIITRSCGKKRERDAERKKNGGCVSKECRRQKRRGGEKKEKKKDSTQHYKKKKPTF